jgi:hypothetical protein
MFQQPITAALAASTTDTGTHPGLFFFAVWALGIAAVIGTPIYIVRQVRERRNRR